MRKHIHEYFINELNQYECKICGLLKSTIEMIEKPKGHDLIIGDKVSKVVGDYGSEWIVRGFCITGSGKERMVAESVSIPGMLHIFNPAQVEKK